MTHEADSVVHRSTAGLRSFLGNRLLLALLGVSLLPLALMGYATYRSAAQAIEKQAEKQLQTVNAITAKAVGRYFQSIEDELRITAENRMTLDALNAFTAGAAGILTDDGIDGDGLAKARRDLGTYYTGDFAQEFERQNEEPIDPTPFLDNLSDEAAYLQYLYIRQNENPLGSKHLLNAATDGSSYSRAHAVYHPIFRNVLTRLGIYDFFLVDAETGGIVYSVFKEIDYATSLKNGSFSATAFARAFQEAVTSGRRDAVAFADFEAYAPSYKAAACFIAAPIFDGREVRGAVVFQLPVDRMNAIIGETTGMGETGETYAVGADRLFRSQSRFAADLGVTSTIINPQIRVDTQAVRAALDQGVTDTAVIDDYRGEKVLSSWRPITIHRDATGSQRPITWALVSEIDRAEVLQPIASLLRFGLTIFGQNRSAAIRRWSHLRWKTWCRAFTRLPAAPRMRPPWPANRWRWRR
jgi:methyl-accepting chemotaxis protein